MRTKLNDFFTYLKRQKEYPLAYEKLKSIYNKHLGNLNQYKKVEDTFINLSIPCIYYYENKFITQNLYGIFCLIRSKLNYHQNSNNNDLQVDKSIFETLASEIIDCRNNYKYLKYHNPTTIEINEIVGYQSLAYQFLKDINIWTIKRMEDDPDGYFWQVEWDIEYLQILKISYWAKSMTELNDIYKMVWLLWLYDIKPNGINRDARIIWMNLESWKNQINQIIKEYLENRERVYPNKN